MIFAIWFIGAIVALLAFKWMKDYQFNVNLDKDGSKIIVALIWPIFVIKEIADMIDRFCDSMIDKINKDTDSWLHKIATKLGNVYRKYL